MFCSDAGPDMILVLFLIRFYLVFKFYDIICIVELESGVTCTTADDSTECISNAECKSDGGSLKCTCKTGFYDNNLSSPGGLCVAGTYFPDEDTYIE